MVTAIQQGIVDGHVTKRIPSVGCHSCLAKAACPKNGPCKDCTLKCMHSTYPTMPMLTSRERLATRIRLATHCDTMKTAAAVPGKCRVPIFFHHDTTTCGPQAATKHHHILQPSMEVSAALRLLTSEYVPHFSDLAKALWLMDHAGPPACVMYCAPVSQ